MAKSTTAALSSFNDLSGLDRKTALSKEYITQAIIHAFPLGRGHGPVHHFYDYWE